MRYGWASTWWDGGKRQEQGQGDKSWELKGIFGALLCCVDTLNTILLQGARLRRGDTRTRISCWSQQLGARLYCNRDSLPYVIRLVLDCCLLCFGCIPGAALACVSSSGISLLA